MGLLSLNLFQIDLSQNTFITVEGGKEKLHRKTVLLSNAPSSHFCNVEFEVEITG